VSNIKKESSYSSATLKLGEKIFLFAFFSKLPETTVINLFYRNFADIFKFGQNFSQTDRKALFGPGISAGKANLANTDTLKTWDFSHK